ncbi:hypothetical protein K4F52_003684 [Lecanicillium sp. MT-2017a]|nr:hypothetical protein K4F52_003684 [Lecanicillium sp. MT-2017a]
MVKFVAALSLVLGLASASPVSSIRAASQDGVEKRATNFWYSNMDHTSSIRGYAPDLGGNYSYEVYKAVSPGDAAGIQNAILDDNGGRRHPQWLASQPRVVYLPPGTYEVSSTIKMNTDTIIMGDATNPPTIKAASGFNGNILLDGRDPTVDGRGELSFAVGLKNIILDTTNIAGGNAFTALHWGVAQGAQLQNVKIHMPSSSGGNGHTGIRLSRGSTLGVSDVRIERGQNGIWHEGHQQAAYKNIYFYQNTIGMLITGGHTVTLMAPTWDTCGTGVRHTGESPYIGIIDGKSINSGVTFVTTQYPSFLIENLTKDTDSDIAQAPNHPHLLTSRPHVDTFTYGNTVGRDPIYGETTTKNDRPAALTPGGKYPTNNAPNYADKTVSDFINVKDPEQNGGHNVLGDNTKDEAGVLNEILVLAARNNKIAYFPFGKYRVESTLYIPVGSQIIGEGWATITGAGDYFKDESNPKPVISVGREGDVGRAHIQDMRFTVNDVLPGAIVVQFNMAGNSPGDVAMWNSLITIGGTRGASALSSKCGDVSNECKAVFLGLHFTKSSSAYVDNVWNWVADHDTEEDNLHTSIAAKGGALVESTKATWLHALGSEHWWLYQLNFHNAENVFVSLLQAETNYDQGDNVPITPPAPWRPDTSRWGDPDFSHCRADDTRCRMGFANYFNGGANIYTYSSAAWAFFSGPGYQGCAPGTDTCQNYMHWVQKSPRNLQAFGLCVKSTYAVLHTGDGQDIVAQEGFTGSWGGLIDRYTP